MTRLQLFCLLLLVSIVTFGCGKAEAPSKADAPKPETSKAVSAQADATDKAEEKASAKKEEPEKAPEPVTVKCPSKSHPCESGFKCTCFANEKEQIVRQESRTKRKDVLRAVRTFTFDESGTLTRMEDDGGTHNKKAKVDGKADMAWSYTYDSDKNRLTHVVSDAAGKATLTCTYKKCPPPYGDSCFRGMKCK